MLITMTTPHPSLGTSQQPQGSRWAWDTVLPQNERLRGGQDLGPSMGFLGGGDFLMAHCRVLAPDSPPQKMAVLWSIRCPIADLWGFVGGEAAKPGADAWAALVSGPVPLNIRVCRSLAGLILYRPQFHQIAPH